MFPTKTLFFKTILATVVCGMVLVGVVIYAISFPTVYFSYSSGECVKVIWSDGIEIPCTDKILSGKYFHAWLE